MRVYVITSGCYSDYGIEGIFSTRKKAEDYITKTKAAKEQGGDDFWIDDDFNDIQEWVLDEQLKARFVVVHSIGIFLDTGDVAERPQQQTRFEVPQNRSYVTESVPAYRGRGVARAQSYKSAAHALKLAVEARQNWMRENPDKISRRFGLKEKS